MPEQNLPSRGVVLQPTVMSVSRLESTLRTLDLPIIGRIDEGCLLLDMRTVADDELVLLDSGLRQAFDIGV